jgi:hypothetical protein
LLIYGHMSLIMDILDWLRSSRPWHSGTSKLRASKDFVVEHHPTPDLPNVGILKTCWSSDVCPRTWMVHIGSRLWDFRDLFSPCNHN